MTIEQEVRDNFKRMGYPLAKQAGFGSRKWESLSQYGYTMSAYDTQEQAEGATIAYYSERMNLIRQ